MASSQNSLSGNVGEEAEWKYLQGEISRTRDRIWHMRKREAFSSPDVTGLGANALIREKNTGWVADCRWVH